jgi:hypothetical protein
MAKAKKKAKKKAAKKVVWRVKMKTLAETPESYSVPAKAAQSFSTQNQPNAPPRTDDDQQQPMSPRRHSRIPEDGMIPGVARARRSTCPSDQLALGRVRGCSPRRPSG